MYRYKYSRMSLLQVLTITSTLSYLLVILGHLNETNGIKLGLFAGDNKRQTNPLIIKKVHRNTPIFISINSRVPKLDVPQLLPEVLTRSRKLPRSLITPRIPKFPLLPLIPPPLPFLPPLVPPILSPLPLLPPLQIIPVPLFPPFLPILPTLSNPLKPLTVPILRKTKLEKALGSDIKPIKLPKINRKYDILRKLLELRIQGSLTTAEYLRFRKLFLT